MWSELDSYLQANIPVLGPEGGDPTPQHHRQSSQGGHDLGPSGYLAVSPKIRIHKYRTSV
jgi:hypothetical protein